MMALDIGREAEQAITLIKSFSLELDEYSPESQVLYWLNKYRAPWIRDAIIEAVYQGRYKIVSVQHILAIWQRRGQPVRHFTSGFEQVIAAQLGAPLHLSTHMAASQSVATYEPIGTGDTPGNNDSDLSPMPTAPSPAVSRIMSDASIISRTDNSDLSIEAFPVDAVDTLVEVYQASGPHLAPNHVTTPHQSKPSNFERLSFEVSSLKENTLPAHSDYGPPVTSAPIQPFRPTARPKRYA
ncbi:MAG: hypothetical protein AAFN42_05445 [Cyanobacteria bacterium J06554_1]